MLIRGLTEVFSLVDQATLQRWESMHPSIAGCKRLYATAREQVVKGHIDEAISAVLFWYEEQIRHIMSNVNTRVAVFSAKKREIWSETYNIWKTGSLLESSALRTI